MTSKLLAAAAILATLALVTSACIPNVRPTLEIPIEVRNADDIGAIAIELVYDSSVLRVDRVDPAELAEGADAGFNKDDRGRLVVVVQNAPSINGDGTLVTVIFDVMDERGETDLVIEDIQARNFTTHEFVSDQAQGQTGNFRADDMSYVAPAIVFVP